MSRIRLTVFSTSLFALIYLLPTLLATSFLPDHDIHLHTSYKLTNSSTSCHPPPPLYIPIPPPLAPFLRRRAITFVTSTTIYQADLASSILLRDHVQDGLSIIPGPEPMSQVITVTITTTFHFCGKGADPI
jgi:hypothetical protein